MIDEKSCVLVIVAVPFAAGPKELSFGAYIVPGGTGIPTQFPLFGLEAAGK